MNLDNSELKKSPSTYHVVLNALLFQGLWFAAILSTWFWALVMLGLMLAHYMVLQRAYTLPLFRLLGLAMMGILWDSLYQFIGVYHFSMGGLALPVSDLPIWLSCLWVGFVLTLPVSMKWALNKPSLFVILSAVGGPLSYVAGRQLDALSFSDQNLWLIVVEWFVFAVIALLVLLPKLGVYRASPFFLQKESSC